MAKPGYVRKPLFVAVFVTAIVVLATLGLKSQAKWRPPPRPSPRPSPNCPGQGEARNSTGTELIRGYLLPVSIEQQSTGALYGFADLATLASLLNLSSVEPYVHASNLVGIPTVGTNVIKLSVLYDFEMLRTEIRSCSPNNDHVTSTFETFLETGSREVVLVYIFTSQGQYKSNFAGSKSRIVEIDANGKGTKQALTRLNKWAAYVSKENGIETATFRVSRVFVMDAQPKKALHLPEIVDVFGSAARQQISKSGSVTMLFDNWRGISGSLQGYYYFIPEFRRVCTDFHEVDHSQIVINASRAFAHHLNDSGNEVKIGVHIRGELLLNSYQGNFVKCLKELENLLHNVTLKVSSSQVHVIHDFSKYGTNECYGDCSKYRSQFLSEIKKLNYRVVYFDPDNFPSFPHNSAFASFVEREYLSGMDVLVTVGRGEFQKSVVERFLKRSSKNEENLHKICRVY